MRNTRVPFAVSLVTCLFMVAPLTARALSSAKQLEKALKTDYTITHVGIDQIRVTEPGTVLVIRQDGIRANPSNDYGNVTDKVINGHVQGPKGFQAALFSNQQDRSLKPGTKVYVTRISVRKNEVQFDILTCSTSNIEVNGNTVNIRYSAAVAFQFPQGFADTMNAQTVKKAVDAVLLPQSDVQAANTKTISLGQTIKQVRANLGAPSRVVNLGPKVIYIYKDMKVIFQDGKVANVE